MMGKDVNAKARTTNNSVRAAKTAPLTPINANAKTGNNNKGPISSGLARSKTLESMTGSITSNVKKVLNSEKLSDSIQTRLVEAVTKAVTDVLAQYFIDVQQFVSQRISELGGREDDLNEIQQYSRRNNLRVFGVPEPTQGVVEDTDTVLRDIFLNQLGVEVRPEEICRSHRISTGKHQSNGAIKNSTPRPIIVKFVSYNTRRRVFAQKRKLKGQRIVIREDLTRKNIELLRRAEAAYGRENTWTSDGRIMIYDHITKRKLRYTDADITRNTTNESASSTLDYSAVD